MRYGLLIMVLLSLAVVPLFGQSGDQADLRDIRHRCAPEDIVLSPELRVCYLKVGDYFRCEVRWRQMRERLSFQYGCDLPASLIFSPGKFDSKFLELRRGCGSFCSISVIVFLGETIHLSPELTNVIAISDDFSWVASAEGSRVKIVDIGGDLIAQYELGEYCQVVVEDLSEAKFEGGRFLISFFEDPDAYISFALK